MAGLMIATPHTRSFYGEYVDCLMHAKKPPPTVYARLEGHSVDEGRNYLTDYFLRHPQEFSHLLFLDSDCTFHPDAIVRLIERRLPIICGCMYKRGLPPMPTLGSYLGRNKKGMEVFKFGPAIRKILAHTKKMGVDETTENAVVLPRTDDDIWEIGGCGMHFTLIRREVLEAMDAPYFLMNANAAGEDFYFCIKARQAGFKIYNDLSVHTGHLLGPDAEIGLREFLAFMKYTRDDLIGDDYSRFDMEEVTVVGKWADV